MTMNEEHREALYKVYSLAYNVQKALRDELAEPTPTQLLVAELDAEKMGIPTALVSQANIAGYGDFRKRKPIRSKEIFESGLER